jgi:hypothetical protein
MAFETFQSRGVFAIERDSGDLVVAIRAEPGWDILPSTTWICSSITGLRFRCRDTTDTVGVCVLDC